MVSFLISRNSKQNITIMITIPDFNLILEDDQKDEFISFWLSIIGSRLLLSRTDRLQCESKHFEQLPTTKPSATTMWTSSVYNQHQRSHLLPATVFTSMRFFSTAYLSGWQSQEVVITKYEHPFILIYHITKETYHFN